MSKLSEEFKKSLKDPSVEEILDLVLFRPIAFIIVKLIYRTPITPNQVSLLSIATGIAGGIAFAQGTHTGFIYGGLFYGFSHVLDCCDGMLARLKGNGTLLGRIVDGFCDYTNATAVFIGLFIGIHRAGFQYFASSRLLVALSALCMIIHCILVDYYKSEFMAHALGIVQSTREEIDFFSHKLEELKNEKGRRFYKLLIRVYLGYSGLQLMTSDKKIEYCPETYFHRNKLLMRLWSWLGVSTHIFFIALAGLLFQPGIFLYFSLVIGNVWTILLLVAQIRVNKSIAPAAAAETGG